MVLVVLAGTAAFALEPRVTLAGTDVSGKGRAALEDVVAGLRDDYATAEIVLHTPDGDLETTAEEVGLAIDVDATVQAALDAGGGPLSRIRSFVSPAEAPVIVTVDEAALEDVLEVKDPTGRVEPVEPSLTSADGSIAVRTGEPGEGLAAGVVADAIVEAARGGDLPIEADVEPSSLPPRFDREDAEALADRARDLVAQPLVLEAAGVTEEIGPATLASWITSDVGEEGLEIDLVEEDVLADLRERFAGVGAEPVDARFTVEGGRPLIVRGQTGTRCCSAEAAGAVLEGLVDRSPEPVPLPLETYDPDRTSADLEQLGIVEQVGSFTTSYPAGQSRVTNIHRIADIVRGTLIGPGGRFSVNDKVGRRTTEKGFVGGGAIQDGVFVESIGGGISQFATTLFNAAFFAGLEIPEYQAHSIYISRYPYGREATLSYPKPDLVIENPSPHGVLVWTSYTSSSVTVSLYSTRWATGVQSGQSESMVGECTRVRTERTRTFVDGGTDVDTFFAVYRPEEGVRCG